MVRYNTGAVFTAIELADIELDSPLIVIALIQFEDLGTASIQIVDAGVSLLAAYIDCDADGALSRGEDTIFQTGGLKYKGHISTRNLIIKDLMTGG